MTFVTDTVDVEATITNTGTVDGTTTVTLDADGSQVALRSPVAVAAGGSETLVLPWDSTGAATGSHSLTVATTTDSASTTVNLQAAASITIDSVTPSNPDPGETADVTVTLSNATPDTRVYRLDLLVDGAVVDQLPVILDGGQSATGPVLSFSSPTAGTKTVEVRAAVASDSTSVTVGSTVAPSLVSHWTFDTADTNSGTAVDVVGSNDGTIQGATTGVSGANQTYTTNEAYSFDGTDDFVEASGVTVTGEFTFAAWVNTDVTDGSFRNIMGDASSSGAKVLIADDNWIQAQIQGSSGTNGTVNSSVINTNQWIHSVAVYDGSTLRLYLDGGQVDSAGSGPKPSGDRTFKIGGQTDFGHYWDGRIDDVRVYDKGLTSTEVSNLYNTGSI